MRVVEKTNFLVTTINVAKANRLHFVRVVMVIYNKVKNDILKVEGISGRIMFVKVNRNTTVLNIIK